MSRIIPVPVVVSVGLTGDGGIGTVRNFGSFRIVPIATTRNGSLEIAGWHYLDLDGEAVDLNDRLLFNVMPRKLLCHICVNTFETEREHLPLVIGIDDQQWRFPMRARELIPNQVHYQVEVEGEWMTVTEAYIGDILGDEQLMFAEREILPTIDFSDPSQVYDEMA